MEYDKFAQGSVLSTGGATRVTLPFVPTAISIYNATRMGTPTSTQVSRAEWLVEMGAGAAYYSSYVATSPVASEDLYLPAATGGGFYPLLSGISLIYGPVINVSAVTQAASAIVTTAAPHNFVTGDVVTMNNLIQTASTGMQQIDNIPFVVTYTGPTTFTIPFNTSGAMFTVYNSGTAIAQATVKKIVNPFLYAPGVSDIAGITLGATTTVNTTAPHNLVVGQEVAFRIPSAWGTVQLNSLPNQNIPGSPIYGYVISVTSPTQVVVNINSTGFTAFTAPTVAQSNAGLAPAQIVSVGDNNSGSNQFGYNPPLVNGIPTINGPAIAGAYLNNTSQGFIIGSTISGTAGDVIYWKASYTAIV